MYGDWDIYHISKVELGGGKKLNYNIVIWTHYWNWGIQSPIAVSRSGSRHERKLKKSEESERAMRAVKECNHFRGLEILAIMILNFEQFNELTDWYDKNSGVMWGLRVLQRTNTFTWNQLKYRWQKEIFRIWLY